MKRLAFPFLTLLLTAVSALAQQKTVTIEGLFWAKLSAASVLAVAPILVLGWLTQKQLVRGLTFGAVK